MNWTLEVVIVPVSDVDRAKEFYASKLGFAVARYLIALASGRRLPAQPNSLSGGASAAALAAAV